jgi:hypothetical protein
LETEARSRSLREYGMMVLQKRIVLNMTEYD